VVFQSNKTISLTEKKFRTNK